MSDFICLRFDTFLWEKQQLFVYSNEMKNLSFRVNSCAQVTV